MSSNGRTTILTIEHEKGCPLFNVSLMAHLIASNRILYGIIFLFVGGISCLFGRNSPRMSLFLITTLTIFLFGTFLSFKDFDTLIYLPDDILFYFLIVLWVILGLILGVVFFKFKD